MTRLLLGLILGLLALLRPLPVQALRVALEGRQTSWPYVAMTMQLMDRFGLTAELERDPDTGDPRRIVIPHPKGEGKIDVSAPLPPHMQQSWNLLGFDAAQYDPDSDDPEE